MRIVPSKPESYLQFQLMLMLSKTEFLLIGLRDQLKKIPDSSISLNPDSASTHTFTPTSPVRNLG